MRSISHIALYPQPVRYVGELVETARRQRRLRGRTFAADQDREVSQRKDRDSFAAELERRTGKT